MEILKATKEDLPAIVDAYLKTFNDSRYFLTNLGKEFLIDLYSVIYEENKDCFFVAKDKRTLIGFIFGAPNPALLLKKLRKNLLNFLWRLLSGKYKMKINPLRFLWLYYQNSMYLSKERDGGELMSMATHEDYRGRGIGSKLFRRFEEAMRPKTKRFYILTYADLEDTIRFYRRLGCDEVKRIRHGEVVILRKELSSSPCIPCA